MNNKLNSFFGLKNEFASTEIILKNISEVIEEEVKSKDFASTLK